MGSIAVVCHHQQRMVEKNNGLSLENSTVEGLLTLKDLGVDLFAVCVTVSDVVDMNHLRLATIGKFQVARSLQLSNSPFSIPVWL